MQLGRRKTKTNVSRLQSTSQQISQAEYNSMVKRVNQRQTDIAKHAHTGEGSTYQLNNTTIERYFPTQLNKKGIIQIKGGKKGYEEFIEAMERAGISPAQAVAKVEALPTLGDIKREFKKEQKKRKKEGKKKQKLIEWERQRAYVLSHAEVIKNAFYDYKDFFNEDFTMLSDELQSLEQDFSYTKAFEILQSINDWTNTQRRGMNLDEQFYDYEGEVQTADNTYNPLRLFRDAIRRRSNHLSKKRED